MSMTREEAVRYFDCVVRAEDFSSKQAEAARIALSALRVPTREMVERMRGRWVNLEGEEVKVDKYGCPVGFASCSVCDDYLTASEEYSCQGRFCPNCGAPMTDEAVDMMLRRWKEAVDGETD